ncbi:uncharacterized protein LOC106068466 [Biomphalaria glabrata]|uniref:Uncharacterized protein LOC106068466 n=1 Tax=Biomphalaria glabrata TaxID=6526 RepID=A0A9U8EE98_BIOGL|nr:uncharacterized protein LOC106068466 [Biomphalaria glabrata]
MALNVSKNITEGQNGLPSANYKIVSDELLAVVSVVMKSAMYDGISGFGLLTNAACLKVFWTMGFKNTINVSFFAITIADMGCLLSLLWMGICYNPLFADSNIIIDSRSVQYLTGGWPKFYFTRVSGMITAYLTFERYLSMTIPLKVKLLLTPRRVKAILVTLYIFTALCVVPIYVPARFTWKWFPSKNMSLISTEFVASKGTINIISNSLNVAFYNGSFVIVVICTAVLILKLNESRAWKKKSTMRSDRQEVSKETRASRRVVFVALLYIVCNLPGSLCSFCMAAFPEFNAGESQQNLFFFYAAFVHIIEAINASCNIFIYQKTSKKFCHVFLQTFTHRPNNCKRRQQKVQN